MLISVLCLGAASGVLLGAGSFGRVYKGRWQGMDVAVKVMEHDSATAALVANEVKLIMSFDHENVVKAYDFMCYVQCANEDTGGPSKEQQQQQSVGSSADSQQQQQQQSWGASDQHAGNRFALQFQQQQQQQPSSSSQTQGLGSEQKGDGCLLSSLQDCKLRKGGDQQHGGNTTAGPGAADDPAAGGGASAAGKGRGTSAAAAGGGGTSAATAAGGGGASAAGAEGAFNTQAEGEGQLGAAAVRTGAGVAAAAAAAAGGGTSPVNFFVTDLGPYWTSSTHSCPSNDENLQAYSTSPPTSAAAAPGNPGSSGGGAAASMWVGTSTGSDGVEQQGIEKASAAGRSYQQQQQQRESRSAGLQVEQRVPARPAQTWLVLEYCELGSLSDVLSMWQHLPCYGRERLVSGARERVMELCGGVG